MAVVGQQSLGYTLVVDVELGLSCRLGFWSWAYHSKRNVCLVREGFAARMEAKQLEGSNEWKFAWLIDGAVLWHGWNA